MCNVYTRIKCQIYMFEALNNLIQTHCLIGPIKNQRSRSIQVNHLDWRQNCNFKSKLTRCDALDVVE